MNLKNSKELEENSKRLSTLKQRVTKSSKKSKIEKNVKINLFLDLITRTQRNENGRKMAKKKRNKHNKNLQKSRILEQ